MMILLLVPIQQRGFRHGHEAQGDADGGRARRAWADDLARQGRCPKVGSRPDSVAGGWVGGGTGLERREDRRRLERQHPDNRAGTPALRRRGPGSALRPKPSQRIYQHKLDGTPEAKLIALACASPPEGKTRWTLRLLAARMVDLAIVDGVRH